MKLSEKLEAENKEKFLKEYAKLVKKYGYDFLADLKVIKITFQDDSQPRN